MRVNKTNTKKLIKVLHRRIGRKPASHTYPGITPMQMFDFYIVLGRILSGLGVRY